MAITPDTDLNRLIDRVLMDHRDLGMSEVAEMVVSAILSSPDPRTYLLPLVQEKLEGRVEIREIQGAQVFESAATRAIAEGIGQEAGGSTQPESDSPLADPLEDRLIWLRDKVYVNKQRGYVAWANLSVEDHKARIVELKRRSEAIDLEIGRHRQAIKEIRSHGARTLAEVYQVRVA